jgi:pilus assembly protein Flp/PilA
MKAFAIRLLKDASGVTAIEYAIIAGLVALVIVGAARTIGSELSTTFNNLANAFG